MKQGSTLFLKFVLLILGIAMFSGLAWFPQTEGRATNLDFISIYKDPFTIFIYIAFIPFFVALYQAFKLLGYIEQNKVFSEISVKALRNIKYCAVIFSGFIIAAISYIRAFAGNDDPAGAIVVGLVVIFASVVIATAAGVFQKLLKNATEIKHENDLTV